VSKRECVRARVRVRGRERECVCKCYFYARFCLSTLGSSLLRCEPHIFHRNFKRIFTAIQTEDAFNLTSRQQIIYNTKSIMFPKIKSEFSFLISNIKS